MAAIYWGTFTSVTDAPNVTTSLIQSAELRVGHAIFVIGSGLYQCTDPTVGAAVWEPLYEGGGGGSGGISEATHEALDTLVHNLAESSFTEYLYTGGDLTSTITWVSDSKVTKIRESEFSYASGNLSQVVTRQYASGTVVQVLTKTLSYDVDDNLVDITTVES